MGSMRQSWTKLPFATGRADTQNKKNGKEAMKKHKICKMTRKGKKGQNKVVSEDRNEEKRKGYANIVRKRRERAYRREPESSSGLSPEGDSFYRCRLAYFS